VARADSSVLSEHGLFANVDCSRSWTPEAQRPLQALHCGAALRRHVDRWHAGALTCPRVALEGACLQCLNLAAGGFAPKWSGVST
jgi:hypothetical protein